MYYSLALGRLFRSFTRVMIHFFFFSHFLLMVLLPERVATSHPPTPESLVSPSSFVTFSLLDPSPSGSSPLFGESNHHTYHRSKSHHHHHHSHHQASNSFDQEHESVVTFTTSESFLTLPKWDTHSRANISLKLKFRTSEPNGVLVYSNGVRNSDPFDVTDGSESSKIALRSRPFTQRDFFAIELLEGLVFLVLNMGTGAIKVKSTVRRVDNGHWHEVSVAMTGRSGNVSVDGRSVAFVAPLTLSPSGQESIPKFDLEGPLFLGALGSPGVITRGSSHQHSPTLLAPPEIWSGSLGYGFVGCVRDLSINDEGPVDLRKFANEQDSSGVRPGCTHISSAHCTAESCVNSVACAEGWNRPVCQCHTQGYTGVNCARKSLTLSIEAGHFVRINLPAKSVTQAEDVYLRFRTVDPSGLLLLASDASTGPDVYLPSYLIILLDSGKLKVILNLGEGNKATYVSLSEDESENLADDNWHSVKVERRGPSLEIKLDGINLVTELTGQRNTLFIDSFFIGSVGGGEKSSKLPPSPSRSSSSSGVKNHQNKQQHQQQPSNTAIGTSSSTGHHSSPPHHQHHQQHPHHHQRSGHHSLLSSMDSALQAILKDVPTFTGFVESFIFNGVDLLDLSRTGQVSGLLNSTAEFNLKSAILTDEQVAHQPHFFNRAVTFKSRKTSVTLAGLKAFSQMKIHFQFKTLSNNGLILFNEGKSSNHFVGIELDAGQLVYVFNLGDGGRKLVSSTRKLNDNQWHSVTIIRSISNLHTLTVDDSVVSMESAGINTHLILNDTAFLGGVPLEMYKSPSGLPKLLKSRHGFEGCLAQIELNGEIVDPTVTSGLVLSTSTLVEPGCRFVSLSPSEKRCTLYACSNVGSCVTLPSTLSPSSSSSSTGGTTKTGIVQQFPLSKSSLVSACDCDEATFLGPTCSLEGVAVRFVQPSEGGNWTTMTTTTGESPNSGPVEHTVGGGSSGTSGSLVTYFIDESAQERDRKEDSIQFGLVTRQANAVIVRIDSSVSSDFIELQLRDGCIAVVYNLGYEDHEITNPYVLVNDEAYHSIRFNRSGPNSTLEIDNHNVIARKPAGRQLAEFNFMAKVQMGGKKSLTNPFPPITLALPLDESRGNSSLKLPNFTGILIGLTLNGERILDLAASVLSTSGSSTTPQHGPNSSSSDLGSGGQSMSNLENRVRKEGHVDFLTNVPRIFNPADLNLVLTNASSSVAGISFPPYIHGDLHPHPNVKSHQALASPLPPNHQISRNEITAPDSQQKHFRQAGHKGRHGHADVSLFNDELILSASDPPSCWSDLDCINFISSPVTPIAGSDELISPLVTRVTDTSDLTAGVNGAFAGGGGRGSGGPTTPFYSSNSMATVKDSSSFASSPRPCTDDEDEECYEEIGSGDRTNQEEGDDEDEPEPTERPVTSGPRVFHSLHPAFSSPSPPPYSMTSRTTSTSTWTSTSSPSLLTEFYEFKPWITSTVYSVTASGIEVGRSRPVQHHTSSSSTTTTIDPSKSEQTYRPKVPSLLPTRQATPANSSPKPLSKSPVSIVDVPKPPERKKSKPGTASSNSVHGLTDNSTALNGASSNSNIGGNGKNPSVKAVQGSNLNSVDRTLLIIGIIASIIIIIVFVAPIILFTKIRMIDPSMTGTFFFTHSSPGLGEATYNSPLAGANGASVTTLAPVPGSACEIVASKNNAKSTYAHLVQASPVLHPHAHLASATSNLTDVQLVSTDPHQQTQCSHQPPYSPQQPPHYFQQSPQPTSILKKTKKSGKEFEWFV